MTLKDVNLGGEADILIGTQIVAKGLDFPNKCGCGCSGVRLVILFLLPFEPILIYFFCIL